MKLRLLFSDFFRITPETVEAYGAFDISLVSDLPLFIDPFLLFNSRRPEYVRLHHEIIDYMQFLYAKSMAGQVSPGLLQAWYHFKEVRQTWLGFSIQGNHGSGLGRRFALALDGNFPRVFDPASQAITHGRHVEKLCLLADRVGRDNISDFTTNLIKHYLLEFTETFATTHLDSALCQQFSVTRSVFNYATESWETRRYYLPSLRGDFVILVPSDLLTRDDTWINRADLTADFHHLPAAIPDQALRAQVDNYFRQVLPRRAKEKERREAIRKTIREFPALLDYYIRRKEDTGDQARSVSDLKVNRARDLFLNNFPALIEILGAQTPFYDTPGGSYNEALSRAHYLKQVIENNDGYRVFYLKGQPIQREEDLQVLYRLTWYATTHDVNREVNNGRGPVDFKISSSARDKALVEFKLASNPQLRRNLEHQVQVYEAANETNKSVKVILFFTALEKARVVSLLSELGLRDAENVVLIDARRDNKVSASKVK